MGSAESRGSGCDSNSRSAGSCTRRAPIAAKRNRPARIGGPWEVDQQGAAHIRKVLPIPPLRKPRYFFAGAGPGLPAGRGGSCSGIALPPGSFTEGPFAGAGALAGADCVPPDVVSKTVLAPEDPRVAIIESASDVIMKTTADAVVAFESSVAEPRGPKAVCEPMPPKAPARSAAFPLCSNTTMIRKMHTATCTIVKRINIALLSV